MKRINLARAAGALAVLALAAPASAAAVPTVYTADAKLDVTGVTFLTDATGAGLLPQTRYAVSSDGYAAGYAETNGVGDGGVLNYAVLPTAYRAPATAEEKRSYPAAQTDLQAHATCDVEELASDTVTGGTNILAWQAGEPSYNYVPWQKDSAGLGDDPAKWIPVVKAATGVDLATAANLTTACTDIGGTYHAADTKSAIADKLVANAVAPLDKQIAALQKQLADLTKAKAALDKTAAADKAGRKAAEEGYQAQYTRELKLTLAGKRFVRGNGVALATGGVGDPVTVTLEVGKKQRRALGLPSRELFSEVKEIDDRGVALVTVKVESDVAKKLAKHGKAVPATVRAESGAYAKSTKVKLVP